MRAPSASAPPVEALGPRVRARAALAKVVVGSGPVEAWARPAGAEEFGRSSSGAAEGGR
ncbi:MAG: hypothetical protein INH41_28165 [Myxococcaceae bacterium]|jgi:hypothetical protein|nr:hypothetical protein [Myxococcaceae bacterium]MCA3016277.1 hypothetical protein [Myxococcaceae bacterium]